MGDIIVPGRDGTVVLLGFPHDEGVRRNGGRVGAADGPAAARGMLSKMGTVFNPEYDVDLSRIRITDGGDVGVGLPLEDAHAQLADAVANVLRAGGTPVVVGGGNDQSYPNARGLLNALESEDRTGRVGVINIDAHLDVRPLKEGRVHSGSPFRLLLEDATFRERGGEFIEFAVQGSQCSRKHADHVVESAVMSYPVLYWLQHMRAEATDVVDMFKTLLDRVGDHVFVSFDIDAISGADAPGVSCPSTVGLTAQEALMICLAAGQNPKVRMLDISELNPRVEDYRTPRLVANMFYYFAMGVAMRMSAGSVDYAL